MSLEMSTPSDGAMLSDIFSRFSAYRPSCLRSEGTSLTTWQRFQLAHSSSGRVVETWLKSETAICLQRD